MEHEMRLAVLPHGPGPMVVPYCIGCGWVGRRRSSPDSLQSVAGEWRTHVKEFNESEARRNEELAIELRRVNRRSDGCSA